MRADCGEKAVLAYLPRRGGVGRTGRWRNVDSVGTNTGEGRGVEAVTDEGEGHREASGPPG